MPELPEVETIRRTLIRKGVVGKQVKKVSIPPSRLIQVPSRIYKKFIIHFKGETITAIDRWGKYLSLQGERHRLILHFGMSGVLYWKEHPSTLPPHLYLQLSFIDGIDILYTDPRTFGKIILQSLPSYLLKKGSIEREWGLTLGPDALLTPTSKLSHICWVKTCRSNRPVKSVLLDQSLLAGVGNIYADESLYATRISPLRPVQFINRKEWDILIRNLKKIFRKAIRLGGSTLNDYRRPDGLEGNFQNAFRIYGKSGESCPTCTTIFEKTIIQSRTTTFCPQCQR